MSTEEREHGALLMETLRMVDKGGTFLKACDSELRQAMPGIEVFAGLVDETPDRILCRG